MTHITVKCPACIGSDGLSGVVITYRRVFLIFTTKLPGVAEVAAFYDSYPVSWGRNEI